MTPSFGCPTFSNRIMVRGVAGRDGQSVANDKPQSAWAERMIGRAHQRGENLVVFVPLVLVAHELTFTPPRPCLPARFISGAGSLTSRVYTAGIPLLRHAHIHRRLDRADHAGAGDFRDDVAVAPGGADPPPGTLTKQRELFEPLPASQIGTGGILR